MDGLLAAVDTLHALVRGSFGPSGQHVLVFAPPDAPLLTGDGHAVLRARKQQLVLTDDASASAAFERVMLDAAEGVYRETGDGATQFVLMLHSVLHQVRRECGGNVVSTAQRVSMARALGSLRHQWGAGTLLSQVVQARTVIEEHMALKPDAYGMVAISTALQARIRHVLTTALTGVLGYRTLHSLVSLVMQWVYIAMRSEHVDPTREPTRFVHRHLQHYLQQAPQAVIHAVGGAFSASHAVEADAFVLQKSLVPSQLPSLLAGVRPLRFVCVTTSLDVTVGSNQITFTPTGPASALHALDSLRVRVVQFLSELRTVHGVGLLISTQKIEDYIAAACNHLGIACVQYTERDEVTALCSITGVHALTSVVEQVDEHLHVGVCSRGASVVRHAQSPSLYLRGLQRRPSLHEQEVIAIPQLVLYASSKLVFKQYYNAVLKGLRAMRSLFADHDLPCCMRLCHGAGATELVIAKALRLDEQQRRREGDAQSPLQQSKALLATALVESVAQLRTNLTRGCSASDRGRASRRSDRALLDEMSRLDVCDPNPRGYVLNVNHSILTELGSIQIPTVVEVDPSAYDVVHPWRRVETIVDAVLHTAERLLRVDAIVHVKGKLGQQRIGLHEASTGDGDT